MTATLKATLKLQVSKSSNSENITDIFFDSFILVQFIKICSTLQLFIQNLAKEPLTPPDDYNPAVTVLQKLTLQSKT